MINNLFRIEYDYAFCGKMIFCTENNAFPSEDWEDFCFYLIHDWFNAIEKIKNEQYAAFELTFMEGDYSIYGIKNNNVLTLSGISERVYEKHLDFELTVCFSDFYEEIIKAKNDFDAHYPLNILETIQKHGLRNWLQMIHYNTFEIMRLETALDYHKEFELEKEFKDLRLYLEKNNKSIENSIQFSIIEERIQRCHHLLATKNA